MPTIDPRKVMYCKYTHRDDPTMERTLYARVKSTTEKGWSKIIPYFQVTEIVRPNEDGTIYHSTSTERLNYPLYHTNIWELNVRNRRGNIFAATEHTSGHTWLRMDTDENEYDSMEILAIQIAENEMTCDCGRYGYYNRNDCGCGKKCGNCVEEHDHTCEHYQGEPMELM